jgi:tocopherol O-methyltransferase
MLAQRRARVAAHYDELSPHYAELWGEHIHHGYYERGDESRPEATRKLVELLLADLELAPGARVLDVGCGLGGTGRLLAREFGCAVTGVTLSSVQARMAQDLSPEPGDPLFLVGDAAHLPLRPSFDAILAIEVLSHVPERADFFREAVRLLRPEGRLGIAAWLAAEELTATQRRAYIDPIEDGMLVTLPTVSEYRGLLAGAGMEVQSVRDVSREVARTWDLCLEIVARPAVWSLALTKGRDVLAFVRSFRAMQRGFASGCFRYGLLTARII